MNLIAQIWRDEECMDFISRVLIVAFVFLASGTLFLGAINPSSIAWNQLK
jgi:hypothetical protein